MDSINKDLKLQQQKFQQSLKQQPVVIKDQPVRQNSPTYFREQVKTVRHLNSYLHTLLTCLKQAEHGISIEELEKRTNIPLSEIPELLELVQRHERVRTISAANAKHLETYASKVILEYQSQYRVKNAQDVVSILRTIPRYHGLSIDALREHSSSSNATNYLDDIINVLEKQKIIFTLSFKDGSTQQKLLFLNWHSNLSTTKIDRSFIDLWQSINPSSDNQEIEKELHNAGLKTMDVFGSNLVTSTSRGRKKPRQGHKRLRLTNVHLLEAGIDLNAVMTLDNNESSK